MDLVVNHTSDEHPWFVEARKSKDNPYRDYYIWRPARTGSEPNNWASHFSGSAWQFDAATGEYYLHLFSKKQPDLNWENPKCAPRSMHMMHWWLKKGVDGFRMDVINMISKVPGLPDAPSPVRGPLPVRRPVFHQRPAPAGIPGRDEARGALPDTTSSPSARPRWSPPQHASEHHQRGDRPLNMVFQFEHMGLDGGAEQRGEVKPWSLLADLKQVMTRWQKDLEGQGWNSNYLTNHDQPRAVSRFGDDGAYRVQSAKMLATFLHLLQGTPYIYQGEEIGMTNVAFDVDRRLPRHRDPQHVPRAGRRKGSWPARRSWPCIHAKGRDNARTPMQWDDSPQAGFTTGTPWLKVNPNLPGDQRRQALADPDSIFHYYQQLIQLRKDNPGHRLRRLRPAPPRPRADLRLHPHAGRRAPAGDAELLGRHAGLRAARGHSFRAGL